MMSQRRHILYNVEFSIEIERAYHGRSKNVAFDNFHQLN